MLPCLFWKHCCNGRMKITLITEHWEIELHDSNEYCGRVFQDFVSRNLFQRMQVDMMYL
jgi:hypothetical protein